MLLINALCYPATTLNKSVRRSWRLLRYEKTVRGILFIWVESFTLVATTLRTDNESE